MRVPSAFFVVLSLIFHALFVFAEDVDNPEFNNKYQLIVKDIKTLGLLAPRSAIVEMRDLYPKTGFYNPYSRDRRADNSKLSKAVKTHDWEQCLSVSSKVLDYNYSSLDGHLYSYICNKRLGKTSLWPYHLMVFNVLFDAIKAEKDGLSMDTAFETYSTSELNTFLGYSGYKKVSQRMDKRPGQVFDVIKVSDNKTGKQSELFFDITKQFLKLARDGVE